MTVRIVFVHIISQLFPPVLKNRSTYFYIPKSVRAKKDPSLNLLKFFCKLKISSPSKSVPARSRPVPLPVKNVASGYKKAKTGTQNFIFLFPFVIMQ